jgi:hypothetical protein
MRQGRKCGEAEVVFLSRLEKVISFGFMRLRRFLNVGLLRLDFSSPFACSSPSKAPVRTVVSISQFIKTGHGSTKFVGWLVTKLR